ncbi:MAG: hypothetical protein WCE49_10640 [Terrimicrobiaceae bacterium]
MPALRSRTGKNSRHFEILAIGRIGKPEEIASVVLWPNALAPDAEYFVPNWPNTSAGKHWFEVTQGRDVKTGRHNREPIFAWEAKVYRLHSDDNS